VLAVTRALVRWHGFVVPPDVVVNESMGAGKVLFLERFQRAEKLPIDGIYGQQTHAKFVSLSLFDDYGQSLLAQEARILAGEYRNPLRDVAGLTFLGYDQGADWGCSAISPIYAAGPGIVTVATQYSSWPGGGAVSYRLTAGKAKGLTIYTAENISVRVAVGRLVNSATPICDLNPGYPDSEHGWAQDGSDNPMSQPISHSPTYFGINYGHFLRSLGETRCPLDTGGGQDTPLPVGWPTWL
jgi:hypothetical protein